MPEGAAVLVTCEHGGKRVPSRYSGLFAEAQPVLASHRGWDPGAEILARYLGRALGTVPVVARITRLLVDLNRSPGHPRQFSEFSRRLPKTDRLEILRRYYRPYRRRVEQQVARRTGAGQVVVHLSVHSFTPEWKGEIRQVDAGILFDPSRPGEKALAGRIRVGLQELRPGWRIRFNQPYRGTSDGLTTWLRRRFSPESYLGLELEFNQTVLAGGLGGAGAHQVVADSVAREVRGFLAALETGRFRIRPPAGTPECG
ncbi:MAG: N-formylglutamate amidohydrolase [Acidobacteriota bacterium]